MFDRERFAEILKEYKSIFANEQWPKEKYKWVALKHFQDNWDINANDFPSMLEQSLKRSGNLLSSAGRFPARMIVVFAKLDTEEVRSMFLNLFDESQEIFSRIDEFKKRAAVLLDRWQEAVGKSGRMHYQDENTITTYLWLRYPERFFIYKYGEIKSVSEELKSSYQIKKGAYANNIRNARAFYAELGEELKKDIDLMDIVQSCLDDTCYRGDQLQTVTFDFGFYISRYVHNVGVEAVAEESAADEAEPVIESESVTMREDEELNEDYTKDDFLNQVYMSEDRYERLVHLLKNKKNIILQGAPGVGKTFTAKRLAYSIMGYKDEDRIEFVQFHQNYSYEDFVMGYKPSEDGFELRNGIFYRFCKKASNHPDKEFFFIIDEINRGNLSKIFGELLMLIERDYRGTKATLAYTGETFAVPENVYIIGMMNTADRSLALIDYALRRRFSFFDIEPGFDTAGFIRYQEELNNETFDELILRIKDLNQKIANDRSLGKGFCIGHSYFCECNNCTDEWMQSVIDYDILPMLSEYWFDDANEVQRWDNILHGVFQ